MQMRRSLVHVQVRREHFHVRIPLLKILHILIQHLSSKLSILRNRCHVVLVSNLQNDLIGLGFSVGPTGADGYYGPNTTEGIREFQRAYGLRVDGAAGPETKAKLYSVRIP